MADFQTLFHNPDCLSDSDLSKIYWKMKVQSYFPYLTAGLGGAACVYADTVLFKRSMCYMRIGAMSFGGFMLGAVYSYQIMTRKSFTGYSEGAQVNMDSDIMSAFENKYIQRSLNAAGYGSNALNMASHTKEQNARYKKPY